jgi:hypothetical protein
MGDITWEMFSLFLATCICLLQTFSHRRKTNVNPSLDWVLPVVKPCSLACCLQIFKRTRCIILQGRIRRRKSTINSYIFDKRQIKLYEFKFMTCLMSVTKLLVSSGIRILTVQYVENPPTFLRKISPARCKRCFSKRRMTMKKLN